MASLFQWLEQSIDKIALVVSAVGAVVSIWSFKLTRQKYYQEYLERQRDDT